MLNVCMSACVHACRPTCFSVCPYVRACARVPSCACVRACMPACLQCNVRRQINVVFISRKFSGSNYDSSCYCLNSG